MSWFLVACGAVVVAASLVYLVHRVLPHHIRAGYNEVNGYFFAAVGALYAVLLAFVVVAVWQDMGTAQQNTYSEANALPGLYFSATAFPQDVRMTFQRAAVAYTRDVIDDEWPALANGQSSRQVEVDAKAPRTAILQVFFALFFGVPKMIPHPLMVSVLTVIVAGTLYLTYLMEQPFRGPMRIEPSAYQVALLEMGQPVQ